jgi:mono/diheme cytochrome c family protein
MVPEGWLKSANLVRTVVVLAEAFGLGAVAMTTSTPALADESLSSIVRGGRLYDNWYKEIKEPVPTESHPAYPPDKKYANEPGRNWRCVECHGWDYQGKDGVYSKGEHFTGIKGIRGMAGADPKKIIAILKDPTHRYGELMPDQDFQDLANFVSKGQVDMDKFIDRASGMPKGDKARRAAYYQTICANCHGWDGLMIRNIPALAAVANDQPWEALHKILNGHPDERMLSLRVLDAQILVDILAYVRTLPTEEILSSIVRGGRLYDNWYKERSERPPTESHPVYPADKEYANDPGRSWRCVECHGWDYQGKEGVYSKGEHFTGIKGIRGMAGADPDKIIAILEDANHRYGGLMDYRDFQNLANFVTRGQVDMDRFIDRPSGMARGDKARRAAYYQTICSTCHGQDGLKILDMPPLGRVAERRPWEALHKIVNGHPDEKMPALRALDMQILVDILAYLQALPTMRYRSPHPDTSAP